MSSILRYFVLREFSGKRFISTIFIIIIIFLLKQKIWNNMQGLDIVLLHFLQAWSLNYFLSFFLSLTPLFGGIFYFIFFCCWGAGGGFANALITHTFFCYHANYSCKRLLSRVNNIASHNNRHFRLQLTHIHNWKFN